MCSALSGCDFCRYGGEGSQPCMIPLQMPPDRDEYLRRNVRADFTIEGHRPLIPLHAECRFSQRPVEILHPSGTDHGVQIFVQDMRRSQGASIGVLDFVQQPLLLRGPLIQAFHHMVEREEVLQIEPGIDRLRLLPIEIPIGRQVEALI